MTTTQKKKDLLKRLISSGRRRLRINFLQCFEQCLEEKKSRMTKTAYRSLHQAKKVFLRYVGKRKVFDFTKFDPRFLLKFESWLKTRGGKNGRPMKANTAKVYMTNYKTIHKYIYKKYDLHGTACFKTGLFEPPVFRRRKHYTV